MRLAELDKELAIIQQQQPKLGTAERAVQKLTEQGRQRAGSKADKLARQAEAKGDHKRAEQLRELANQIAKAQSASEREKLSAQIDDLAGMDLEVDASERLDGAVALAKALKFFDKGRLVLNIAEIPFKCPVAPLEFVFLADWFFHERGVRDKVEIELVTPLPHAFTKPKAAAILGDFCERKNIIITPNFNIGEVNAAEGYIEELGAEGRKVNFDLLVAIPPNLGPR